MIFVVCRTWLHWLIQCGWKTGIGTTLDLSRPRSLCSHIGLAWSSGKRSIKRLLVLMLWSHCRLNFRSAFNTPLQRNCCMKFVRNRWMRSLKLGYQMWPKRQQLTQSSSVMLNWLYNDAHPKFQIFPELSMQLRQEKVNYQIILSVILAFIYL